MMAMSLGVSNLISGYQVFLRHSPAGRSACDHVEVVARQERPLNLWTKLTIKIVHNTL